MKEPFLMVAILIGVIFFIVRQVMPKRVSRLDFLALPFAAAYEADHTMPYAVPVWNQNVELITSVLFSLAIGIWQAYVTRVFKKGNQVYTQGGVAYLIAWGILIVGRIFLKLAFEGSHGLSDFNTTQWILWADVAVAWGVRSGLLYLLHPEIGHAMAEEKRLRPSERGHGRGRSAV